MSSPPLTPPGLDSRWHFTVGPTQLHSLVPEALRRAVTEGLPSWSHRSGTVRKEVARTVEALGALLSIPDGYRVLFLGSATEAMERLVEGAVERRSFHLVNGAFARRFRGVARNLGRETRALEVPDGEGYPLETLTLPADVELAAFTQNETSTGAALDPMGIAGVARRYPEVLTAVDVVTAAPTAPLELAAVDAAFFSVQKLFGLPPGLGVLVVSPRLLERSRELQGRGVSVGGYQTLPAMAEAAGRNETVVTPNTLGIHLLGRVAEHYLERGRGVLRLEGEDSARTLRAAAAAAGWADFPRRPEDRSATVLVFRVPGGSPPARERLAAAGYAVSSGYGERKEELLRIASFPVHPPEAVAGLAAAIRFL